MTDHIPDTKQMVENLRAIAESLTDWDNPINAKAEIEEVIHRIIDLEADALNHDAIKANADSSGAMEVSLRKTVDQLTKELADAKQVCIDHVIEFGEFQLLTLELNEAKQEVADRTVEYEHLLAAEREKVKQLRDALDRINAATTWHDCIDISCQALAATEDTQ